MIQLALLTAGFCLLALTSTLMIVAGLIVLLSKKQNKRF